MRSDMNFIKRRIMETFAEAAIDRMSMNNRCELREMGKYVGRSDYPYDNRQRNEVFWTVYRRLVGNQVASC